MPKRTGKDRYFRVPARYGDIPAGITLDDTESQPRDLPLAKVAFAKLARVQFPEGFGGEIVDGEGRVLETYG